PCSHRPRCQPSKPPAAGPPRGARHRPHAACRAPGGRDWVAWGKPAPADPARRNGPDRNLVTERPYVLLSCAISVDGCLDSPGRERLVLSGAADLDRGDGERAGSDAVMVGAGANPPADPRGLLPAPRRRGRRRPP